MAITAIDIIDRKAKKGRDRLRSSTHTYRVMAPVAMTEVDVLDELASSFEIFDAHPDDESQRLREVALDLESKTKGFASTGEVYTWILTLDYGPWDPAQDSESGNPLEKKVEVKFDSETTQEPGKLDIDGKPICNTAGDPFDPAIPRDRTRPIIRIIRNEATFSDSTILAYADKVNSDTFYVYPPRTLKCAAPVAEAIYSPILEADYYKVEYRLLYNPDTWDAKALNMGYRELKVVDGVTKQVQILDGMGQPITSPAFLDEDGKKLDQPIDDANIIELTFKLAEELDFTTAFAFPTGILS